LRIKTNQPPLKQNSKQSSTLTSFTKEISKEDINIMNVKSRLQQKTEDSEEDVYEVEKIISMKIEKGEKLFLVKELNHSEQTWEPIRNLIGDASKMPHLYFSFLAISLLKLQFLSSRKRSKGN
jgi:hypothetical protein